MVTRPVRDYLAALAIVLSLAIAYRLTVVPLIEPASGSLVEVQAGMQELVGPDLAHVFPPGSWQIDNPKFLQADWGWVLFQESVQDSADRWRVSPVSIVLHREDEGRANEVGGDFKASEPIILNALEGAVIEFDEPLNMVSGVRPQIRGGQLLGEVHIFNHLKEQKSHYQLSGQADSRQFRLVTRNVRIDNRQIRSAEAVELSIGESRVLGRDLTIKLAGGKSIPTAANSQLSMLDSLELIYLDELTVPLPEGPLWLPQDSEEPYADTRLNVVCDGRVVFDFATFTLRLNQRVELQHHWSKDKFDSFACRTLEIKLVNQFDQRLVRARESSTKPADLAVSDGTSAESSVQRVGQFLRSIIAQGSPIQADVPSLNSRLTASELEFDAEQNRFRMTGGADTIDLEFKGIHLAIPSLEYELNDSDPTAIGKLTIAGAGRVRVSDETIPVRTFNWDQSLQILPEQVGNLLWIVGNVEGRMRDGGIVRADDLLVAFQVIQNSLPASVGSPGEREQRSRRLQLNKLRAKGNVQVDTSELAANTDVLLVLFEHLVDSQAEAVAGSSLPLSLGPKLNPASGPKQRFWVNDPQTGSSGEESDRRNAVAPVAIPRPRLSGGAITANLVMSNNQVVAHDLSVLKNVKLQHELQTKTDRLPLIYTGDSLRLITGSGDDRVQIAGSPARIDLGNGYFEGPLVVISGLENRISIRDHGTFRMPLALMPAGQGQTARWISPPTCVFRGELTFDGRLAEITDDVRLTGEVALGEKQEVWSIDATAPKLEMLLDRIVQVTSPTDAKAAAVERISLVGTNREVLLRATKFAQGQPLGHHVLNNPRLDFYAATGQLLGQGPGWYRSWTPTQEESPLRSIAPNGSLMALHLLYNGGIEGNLGERQLGFNRGVRIGMSAVPDWNSNIDAGTMSQLKLNQGTVDCDRLQLGVAATRSKSSDQPLPWEIQALGGVAFRMMTERGLVDGTAARAAYDAGNDLFVLEGSPASDAVVRNTSLTGQPLMNVSMLSFTLRPETLEINTLVRGATVSQLPVGQAGGQRP